MLALLCTRWGKKLHSFILAIICQAVLCFDNFWLTDTEVNLQQNCKIIAHLSWWVFLPYLVKYYTKYHSVKSHSSSSRRRFMSLAVSDKRIPEWLSIICSLQDWNWSVGHVWCEVQGVVSQQFSALVHAWCAGKQKSPAAWQMYGSNCLSSKTSQ